MAGTIKQKKLKIVFALCIRVVYPDKGVVNI
jgi:hypothetical protein